MCAVGLRAQTAFIPTASLCPAGQIGSYTVSGVVGTLSLIKFNCLVLSPTVTLQGNTIVSVNPPAPANNPPTVLTNKNIYIMANCPQITVTGDGTTTSFAIPPLPQAFAPIILKNGIPMSAVTDYSVVGTNLIFTVAPLPTDNIAIFSTILVSF